MKRILILCLTLVFISSLISCKTPNEQNTIKETSIQQEVIKSEQEREELPTVVILATGGTIAGTGTEGKNTNYKPGQLDVESLVESVNGLSDLANIRGLQFCNINSDDFTDKLWIQLANTINEMASDPEIDGFVITHGTDTMEETAYFLNLTLKTEKPVVLTGASRPATGISADGPMNLYQAVALAGNSEAYGQGVLVLYSDVIYGARDVQKINTYQANAFNEKAAGSMGYMVENKAFFLKQTSKIHTTQSEFDVSNLEKLPQVEVAYFHVDANADVLNYFAKSGAEGIVIAGAGAGEYSDSWNKEAQELGNSGFPVIRCSRIANGHIAETDSYGENVLEGEDLPPQKAAILLRLALTKTKDLNEIANIFKKY